MKDPQIHPKLIKSIELWRAITGPAMDDKTPPAKCLIILRYIEKNMNQKRFVSFQSLSRSIAREKKSPINQRLDISANCAEFLGFIRQMINAEIESLPQLNEKT